MRALIFYSSWALGAVLIAFVAIVVDRRHRRKMLTKEFVRQLKLEYLFNRK